LLRSRRGSGFRNIFSPDCSGNRAARVVGRWRRLAASKREERGGNRSNPDRGFHKLGF
jgi:hypothetical protein